MYYSLGTGFLVSQDAVIYGNQTLEIRYDTMVRESSSGTVYGPVSSVVGDLARMPASWAGEPALSDLHQAHAGRLQHVPDAGLDGFTRAADRTARRGSLGRDRGRARRPSAPRRGA